LAGRRGRLRFALQNVCVEAVSLFLLRREAIRTASMHILFITRNDDCPSLLPKVVFASRGNAPLGRERGGMDLVLYGNQPFKTFSV